MQRLKKRAEFLAAATGRRQAKKTLVLQMACQKAPDDASDRVPRFGFTVTRKVGPAVIRNRVRRRLKAAVGAMSPDAARPGVDYVLIGRRETLAAPFERIVADLGAAMLKLHRACDADEPVPPAPARRGRTGNRTAPPARRPAGMTEPCR